MPSASPQSQAFGDISLSGEGNSVTINQLIQVSDGVLREQPFLASSPYLGLHRFEEQHRSLFFGRDALAAELLAMVQNRPLTLVLGASGSGKSSLVRAGLIPLLRARKPRLQALCFVPDRDPFESLRAALIHAGHRHADVDQAARADRDTLHRICQNVRLRRGGEPWLLFIDQLEEIFTRGSRPETEARFLDALVILAQAAPADVHVVATLRADFLDRLDPYPHVMRLVKDNWLPITRPDASDLRLCIEQPAAHHGVLFEPGLVDTILRDVAGQAGGLPLLQYTLDRLWQEDAPQVERRTLQAHSYHRLGGVRGALRQRADALCQFRSGVAGDARSLDEIAALRRLFLRMVTWSDVTGGSGSARPTAQRVPISDLSAAERLLVDELAEEKLLVTSRGDDGVATVELAHEALLDGWPQMQGWVAQARDALRVRNRLAADARTWQSVLRLDAAQASEELWRGSRLVQARELQDRGEFERVLGGLSDAEQEFLNASWAAQEVQTQRELRQREELATALADARAQQALAEQRELDMYVEQGRQLLVEKGRPIDAVLWLQHAQSRGSHHRMLPYLLADAMRPIDALCVVLPSREAILTAAISPDSQWVVTGGDDSAASLWDVHGELRQVLRGHRGRILDASFSPCGRYLLTASSDLTARIWDLQAPAADCCRHVLSGHRRSLRGARFSPDGCFVVTNSADQTVQLWHVETGERRLELHGHTETIGDANFSPDGRLLVTASIDRTARIWDLQSGATRTVLSQHGDEIWKAEFSPDGRYVVTAGREPIARVFLVESGELIAELRGHSGVLSTASFSPDGQLLVTASADRTSRVWDARTGRSLRTLPGEPDWVLGASFSPDGRHILTACYDGTARIWHADSGTLLGVLQGHSDRLSGAAWSRRGDRVLTFAQDNTVRIWAPDRGHAVRVLSHGPHPAIHLSFSPSGDRLAAASAGAMAQVFSLTDPPNAEPLSLVGHSQAVKWVHFSPDGRRIVTVSTDTLGVLWDAQTGLALASLDGHTYWVKQAQFSPDGQAILTLTEGGKNLRLWHGHSGQPMVLLQGHSMQIAHACFSPDGKYLASGSLDATARLWNFATQTCSAVLLGHLGAIEQVCFHPSAPLLATASRDKTARLWNIASGDCIAILRGHRDAVSSVCFSPDGSRLLSASHDGTARLWHGETGHPQGVLQGHAGRVHHAAFSPDGHRILTLSQDQTLRLWQVETARPLAILTAHRSAIHCASFSPDGRQVASAAEDGTVLLWNVAAESRQAALLAQILSQRVAQRWVDGVIVPLEPAVTGVVAAAETV